MPLFFYNLCLFLDESYLPRIVEQFLTWCPCALPTTATTGTTEATRCATKRFSTQLGQTVCSSRSDRRSSRYGAPQTWCTKRQRTRSQSRSGAFSRAFLSWCNLYLLLFFLLPSTDAHPWDHRMPPSHHEVGLIPWKHEYDRLCWVRPCLLFTSSFASPITLAR